MLRALDPEESPDAYRVPWRVDRVYGTHPLVTNVGDTTLDLVRVLIDAPGVFETDLWGTLDPGETVEMCLCDVPEDAVITVAWFRPTDGAEYVWRFVM